MSDERTDEELNLIIAEWRGWTTRREGNVVYLKSPDGNERWGFSEESAWKHAPNYCNDLNAMHEAESGLTTNQVTHYVTHLRGMEVPIEWSGCMGVHSTAHQRAEALVRVIEEGRR